jgi:hypothetical protein
MKVLATVLALVILAGCGGGEKEGEKTSGEPKRPAAAQGLPSCNARATGTALPETFPRDFPLPRGTVVTEAQRLPAEGASVRGVVPMGLKQAAAFFTRRVPAVGFIAGEADSEPWEAESEFSGKGIEGKWKVNELPGCLEKSALLVVVAEEQ